ncbi:MAG: hypothetical protein HQK65_22095 [Desulfamplus sp.]|nr:hypothetical protein [Desulfamplus sp.]
MQCKLFSGFELEQIEEDINNWLEATISGTEKEGYEFLVDEIKQTVSDIDGEAFFLISIFYWIEKDEEGWLTEH